MSFRSTDLSFDELSDAFALTLCVPKYSAHVAHRSDYYYYYHIIVAFTIAN